MKTDETQGEYITDAETSDALEMLGKGYDHAQPAVIIERPRKAHGVNNRGLEELQLFGWVKMSAKFCLLIKDLRGAKLSIWLCLALVIDENGECGLTQKQLCGLTGYSHTEIIDSVRELDEMGLLSVDRSGKSNLYRPSYVAKGNGNSPIVKKLDSTPVDSVESTPARGKKRPTYSKKELKNLKEGASAKPPKQTEPKASDFPELVIFREVVRHWPKRAQRDLVIDAIQKINTRLARPAVADDLKPFWLAWNRVSGNEWSLVWLEWAETGQIPTNGNRPPVNKTADKAQAVLASLKSLSMEYAANGE